MPKIPFGVGSQFLDIKEEDSLSCLVDGHWILGLLHVDRDYRNCTCNPDGGQWPQKSAKS